MPHVLLPDNIHQKAIDLLERTDKQADREAMTDHEQILFDRLEKAFNEGEEKPRMDKIFGDTPGFNDDYKEWTQKLKEAVYDRGWYDRESEAGRNKALVTLALLIIGTFGVMFLSFFPGLLAMMGLVVAAFASLGIAHKSAEGKVVKQALDRYQTALKEQDQRVLAEIRPGIHFIYSVALGLSASHLKKLYNTLEWDALIGVWLIIDPAMASDMSNIAGTMSQMASSTSFSGGGAASAGTASGGGGGGVG